MLSICGFLALARVIQGEVVPIRNMRPSVFLARLNELMPSTVVTADDERGVLVVKAGTEIVERVKNYAALFDVKPRRVRLKIETDSPIDREHGVVETTIGNNRPFEFTDATTNVQIAAVPRVNEDGSVTVYLTASYQGSKLEIVFRCKDAKPVPIRLGRTAGEVTDSTATNADRLAWPTVSVSAKVLDGDK